MRDRMNERPRLSRSRAGDDEERTARVRRRVQLRRIQLAGECVRRCQFERARAGRVEARNVVGHTTCWARTPPEARGSSHLRFETTKGVFFLVLHRDWAPIGADRIFNLDILGYYG